MFSKVLLELKFLMEFSNNVFKNKKLTKIKKLKTFKNMDRIEKRKNRFYIYGGDPGMWTSLPSTRNVECRLYLQISYLVIHQESVLDIDSISLNVRILLQHRQNHTHYVHSHCFCNTLLIMFLNQSQFSALSPIPTPRQVHTASHNRTVLVTLSVLWRPAVASIPRYFY